MSINDLFDDATRTRTRARARARTGSIDNRIKLIPTTSDIYIALAGVKLARDLSRYLVRCRRTLAGSYRGNDYTTSNIARAAKAFTGASPDVNYANGSGR